MELGESRVTNMILRMLGNDVKVDVNNYINDVSSRNFIVMKDMSSVHNIFNNSMIDFLSSLTQDELLDLRSYTGYNYKFINAILRDNWTYESNGILTEEKKMKFRRISDSVSRILNNFKMPGVDFVSFRGTTIDAFSDYGIRELSELEKLNGKFMYERGFTSTSILEESSYFNKALDDGRFCNIGIKYLIPSECDDGALLINNDMSYSVNQNEFLINCCALTKVMDVMIDKENNTAILTVMLIPKKVYDINYCMNNENVKNR